MRLIDLIFRQFDNLCGVSGLQKIETVGKTYMAAAGLKDSSKTTSNLQALNPVARAVVLSFEMIDAIKLFSFNGNEKIKIKIGIHFGHVIAGVIGSHKPQFSLIGDTVNMTSRVCSTADQGSIVISEEAYKQVKMVRNPSFN